MYIIQYFFYEAHQYLQTKKIPKVLMFGGNGPLKRVLWGKHGFTKQPIRENTNLSACFVLFFKKNFTKTWKTLFLKLEKKGVSSKFGFVIKTSNNLKINIIKKWAHVYLPRSNSLGNMFFGQIPLYKVSQKSATFYLTAILAISYSPGWKDNDAFSN